MENWKVDSVCFVWLKAWKNFSFNLNREFFMYDFLSKEWKFEINLLFSRHFVVKTWHDVRDRIDWIFICLLLGLFNTNDIHFEWNSCSIWVEINWAIFLFFASLLFCTFCCFMPRQGVVRFLRFNCMKYFHLLNLKTDLIFYDKF